MSGNFDSIYVLNIEKKILLNINDVPGNYFNLLKPWNGMSTFIIGSNKYGQFFLIRNYGNIFPIKKLPFVDSFFILDFDRQKSSLSALPFSYTNWAVNIRFVNDTLLCLSNTPACMVFFVHYNSNTWR